MSEVEEYIDFSKNEEFRKELKSMAITGEHLIEYGQELERAKTLEAEKRAEEERRRAEEERKGREEERKRAEEERKGREEERKRADALEAKLRELEQRLGEN